jgi:predicted lipid carrier protein YhbT
MPSASPDIPVVPPALSLGLRPLPLGPLALALETLVRSVARRHGSIFARLGEHAARRFLIAPTDLPFVVVLMPRVDDPAIQVERTAEGIAADAAIRGPLAALIGLLHGAYDGDALFFSRDLAIEGDVAAVLALRNALDDAELDLVAEAAAILGPLASPAEQAGRLIADVAERLTGVSFARPRSRA